MALTCPTTLQILLTLVEGFAEELLACLQVGAYSSSVTVTQWLWPVTLSCSHSKVPRFLGLWRSQRSVEINLQTIWQFLIGCVVPQKNRVSSKTHNRDRYGGSHKVSLKAWQWELSAPLDHLNCFISETVDEVYRTIKPHRFHRNSQVFSSVKYDKLFVFDSCISWLSSYQSWDIRT